MGEEQEIEGLFGFGLPLEEPPDIILQLEDAMRKSAENNRNFSSHPDDDFLLPQILNSTFLGNTNHAYEDTLIKTGGELAGIYTAYSVVFIISLFANTLVCFVIIKNKRFRTVTYAFIANLSASDLTITLLNIPFNLMRFTMRDWIFGEFMCRFTNLTLMCSIYASTYTMAAIAIDRYMVILYPFKPRLTFGAGVIIVVFAWITGILMSLPFALFSRVQKVDLLLSSITRCRLCYPHPELEFEKYMTLATFIAQFVLPIALACIAYSQIVHKLWSRELVGQATANQKVNHDRTRKRTIKMLIIVVMVFFFCWLPLNLYHVLTDFHPDTHKFYYNSSVYLTCHWLAISSCCYNPFIYCWFNGNFRQVLRARLTRKSKRNICIRPGILEIKETPEVRSMRYQSLLARMRRGSGVSRSSGTKTTCRSKSSSRRDRNPRRVDIPRQPGKKSQLVLNTV